MNDPMNQSKMMNHSQVMMNQPPQIQILSQPPPQLMNQRSQMLGRSQLMMNQSQTQGMGQSQMMNRSYGMWPPPPQTSIDMLKFPNPMKQQGFMASNQSKPRNWKGKKGNDMKKDGRRKEKPVIAASGSSAGPAGAGGGVGHGGGGGYKPPTLNELQHQNRLKARRFYPKKKNNRFAPYAPRNTTSFIIRAKKSGGIASLVSPCPVTPAVLPTPMFSPSREVLGDMAKEEWGVDGYGSMNGLIRLRSPGNEADPHEDEEEEEGGSSESDVEEHVEVERRLDHDLSRFEMIYPNYGVDHNNVLENRVDDQDTHIAHLEEENLILKERLYLMEREFGDLRRRLQGLERRNHVVEEINEEVVENVSKNGSEGRDDVRSTEENNEVVEENNEGGKVILKGENNEEISENECARDVCMEEFAHARREVISKNVFSTGENNEVVEENNEGREVILNGENNEEMSANECARDVCMEEFAHAQREVIPKNQSKDGGLGNGCSETSIAGSDVVCMEEFARAQSEVTAEEQSKDGVGSGCSEKSIGDGDLSNCPALISLLEEIIWSKMGGSSEEMYILED